MTLESSIAINSTLIIPVKDQRTDWLKTCIDSALQQSVVCNVIIVYSNLTSQSSVDLIDHKTRENSNLTAILRPPGMQFGGAINLGIKHVNTSRFALLFSDDWLDPHCVESCQRFQADIVSTSHIGFNKSRDQVLYRREISSEGYSACQSLEEKASYLGHFFLFNTDLVRRIGGIDESIGLTGADDYDMIWTLLEAGATVAVNSDVLYYVCDHDGDRLTNRSRELQEHDIKKIFKKHKLPETKLLQLLAAHSHWYGRPTHEALKELKKEQKNQIQDS